MNSSGVITRAALDVERIRQDFPILHEQVHGKDLVYLDNAATTQKPQLVIDALTNYYTKGNANVHRAVHYLSQTATEAYEGARAKVQRLINAAESREIVWVRSATEGINLVAGGLSALFKPGDEILVSNMEHHSNIVPWQMLCQRTGAHLRVIPIDEAGQLEMDRFEELLNPRTKLVSVVHVSNALGTVNPIKRIIDLAHEQGIPVLIDGAQGVQHYPVDVQELDCEFYAISGHKMYGPTGIGALYGKADWLERIPPYQGGGDMILRVSFEGTTYNEIPFKFEAGTPHIAGSIGMGAAVDYLQGLGLENIARYEHDLLEYATQQALQIPGLHIVGTADVKSSVLSFTLDKVHPHDIGTILDLEGIAIRTGHHCAQPVMDRYQIPGTARISLCFYNTRQEIDVALAALRKVQEVFS